MYSQKVIFDHCYVLELYDNTTTTNKLIHANILFNEDTEFPDIQLKLNFQLIDLNIELFVELQPMFEYQEHIPDDFLFCLPLVSKKQSLKQISYDLYSKLLLVISRINYTL